MIKTFLPFNCLILLIGNIFGQQFISSDPFNVLKIEQKQFSDSVAISNMMLRPITSGRNTSNWHLLARSEFYYNNNAPNFENMGNRFIGKGGGMFTSINLSYSGKYISFSLEPFYLNSQNKEVMTAGREAMFGRLNDTGYNRSSPYSSIGLRETQLYLHYKHIGVGYSNANMWWGPGLHSTLTMTNNTTGFPHLMIGTLNEKRFRNIGVNVRYVFSTLDKTVGDPYFTALVWTLRFYTDPIITIGLSRNYLSGGLPTDRPFTRMDAALIVFEQLLVDTKIREYPPEWDPHDPWDELMSGFFMLDFPLSNLRLYTEFGTNDHRQNFSDLRAQPDHASAYILGMRKYGLFQNDNYVAGFEYTNLILGKFWENRATPNWYDRDFYDYSSYDGRRWAAHSGSDSDDLYIYFGYQSDKWTFIPALNYERHGVLYTRPAEVKMELRLDFRYTWNDYRFNMFFEREWLEHAGFVPNKWRIGNVIWFGVERDLTALFAKKASNFRKTSTE
jgi:hypothetical protein